MAKIKLTKKEIPFLSKELDLDETVLVELKKLQNSYQAQFETDIKKAQEEVLISYKLKIAALQEAKARLINEYDAEINKYTALLKDLSAQPTKEPVKKTEVSKSAK